RLPQAALGSVDAILALRVRAATGQLVPLAEMVNVVERPWADAVHHKDLLPYTFVTGDDAGSEDSPVYGMFRLVGKIAHTGLAGHRLQQEFTGPPPGDTGYSVRWSGE